jgi:hypothetical protein
MATKIKLIEPGAVTGNIIPDGGITTGKLANDAVTTIKISDANITHAKLHTSMDLTGKTVTVATAAGSTNTTAAASTAFVQQELTTLIGGAPSTLNDLNELAAAINDDANYNSTLTTALATKLPLAGGTMTGNLIGTQAFFSPNTAGKNTITITTNAVDDGRIIIKSDTTDKVDIQANGTTYFNGGNVGIGETSPDARLDIKSSGASSYPLLIKSSDDQQLFRFREESDTRGTFYINDASENSKVTLASSGNSSFMGGNVGIGTSSPQHELVVASTGNTTLGLVGSGYDDAIAIRFGGGDLSNSLGNGNSGAAIISQQSVSSGQARGDLRFQINGGDLLDTAMYINTSGTVDVANDLLANNAKLKAIAESNTDTAVDVFVYDTRKDSDGGAWRKRTQNTSWYNETLNTSTRGARKEFPSVAVIVLESNKTVIYDGDDPDMPMWMTFVNAGASSAVMVGELSNKCVTMLNGNLGVGSAPYDFYLVNFIKDKGYQYSNNVAISGTYKGDISTRNVTTTNWSFGTVPNIVGRTIYDVAMTVLPNAPIDADTGLPVPTIAVATDGGVSIIKDNGSVVDLTGTSQGTDAPVDQISFVGNHSILFSHRYASEISTIPTVDTSATYYNGLSTFTGRITNSISHDDDVHVSALSSDNNIESIALNEEDAASKSVSGLSLANHYRVASDPDRVSCFITSDYNTGWMNGDIKLATLSDTDTTNVTGSELISGGNFSNWSTRGGAGFTVNGNGTASLSNGDATTDGWLDSPSFSTVNGKTYVVRIETSSDSGTGFGIYYNYGNGPNSYLFSRTFTFVANGGTTTLSLYRYNGHNGTSTLNSISVRLAEEDRSVNGNGLQVFGTITKTAVATGADLVGYSGFSTSNYLEQPYNPALAFDTGGYSIAVWVNRDSGSALRYVYSRGTADASESIRLGIANSGVYFDYGNGSAYTQTNINFPNAVWTHILCTVNAGGKGKVYVNGIEQTYSVNNVAPSPLMNAANYTSLIGRHYDNNNDYVFSGDIALLRISATAPSEEQIAKMYNDEKHLFQTNAKATLYGTSNAVTALAYDDDTELLHVGTSAGRSVFQGLNRVDNTTDAVGAAISASNGFIVED